MSSMKFFIAEALSTPCFWVSLVNFWPGYNCWKHCRAAVSYSCLRGSFLLNTTGSLSSSALSVCELRSPFFRLSFCISTKVLVKNVKFCSMCDWFCLIRDSCIASKRFGSVKGFPYSSRNRSPGCFSPKGLRSARAIFPWEVGSGPSSEDFSSSFPVWLSVSSPSSTSETWKSASALASRFSSLSIVRLALSLISRSSSPVKGRESWSLSFFASAR